jgi:WD40 repeat protein
LCHSQDVTSVTFSADGKRIISGSADGHVQITETGAEVSGFTGVR